MRFKVVYEGIGITHPYVVVDMQHHIRWEVAKFFNKEDANEYVEFLNTKYGKVVA